MLFAVVLVLVLELRRVSRELRPELAVVAVLERRRNGVLGKRKVENFQG
jgi:hypothetical protein